MLSRAVTDSMARKCCVYWSSFMRNPPLIGKVSPQDHARHGQASQHEVTKAAARDRLWEAVSCNPAARRDSILLPLLLARLPKIRQRLQACRYTDNVNDPARFRFVRAGVSMHACMRPHSSKWIWHEPRLSSVRVSLCMATSEYRVRSKIFNVTYERYH
jgi:hypothetical protein